MAGQQLHGRLLPNLKLRATVGGAVDLAEAAAGTLVLYVYPRTGDPGEPVPADWDAIPGARGCTPQNCAFRDHEAELAGLGATVHGLSAQPLEEQRAFAEREHMPYPLLNDEERLLERELGLPTFDYRGRRYYERITLIANGGRIEKVFHPVAPTSEHVDDVLSWLREST